jgi:glycine hydroxymethyltransferase
VKPDPVVVTAYRSALEVISAAEPDVANAIVGELESQRRQLKLIASENHASPAVLLAVGGSRNPVISPSSQWIDSCE